jgi:hypothetical protein
MWNQYRQAQLDQFGAELEQLLGKDRNKAMSDHDWKRLATVNDEVEKLMIERDNYKKALTMSGYASPAEWGITANPGFYDDGGANGGGAGVRWKSFGLPNPEKAPQVAARQWISAASRSKVCSTPPRLVFRTRCSSGRRTLRPRSTTKPLAHRWLNPA